MASNFPQRAARAVYALAAALFVVAGWNGGALAAQDIIVPIDEAMLLRLDRPSTEIIIGNPSVADIAVQNAQLLVVTGKTFGITNVIVLDAQGREVLNRKLRVQSDQRRLVRVYKGKGRASYDCTPRCETALIIGDHDGHFEAVAKEIRNKFGVAQSALDGDQGGGQ